MTSAPGDGVTTLLGFAVDGRPLGELSLPVELTVLEVDRERILGVYEAETGEPHVALYRFRLNTPRRD